MLSNTKDLKGLVVRATDGEIGTIDQFYFDDETWVIRYLTVETGGWLEDRKVLISPISVAHTDWQYKQLDVALTKKQVENSPDIDTHRPISRQAEAGYLEYYGYPYYWGFYPSAVAPTAASADSPADGIQRQSPDTHLRSTDAITGYRVEAVDGEIGHVEDFIVDDETWAIQHLVVDTGNWLPGKKVFIAPAWIKNVNWTDSSVYIDRSREAVKNSPEFDSSDPIYRNPLSHQ
jgi:sporulation protein YlmC with PRC-barrel domain